MMNAYWNNKGIEQAKYDEMENAGWQYTKKTESAFHSYYRYYNDGDLPGWARGNYRLTQPGRWGRELSTLGQQEFEIRITDVINAEYKRFQKANKK